MTKRNPKTVVTKIHHEKPFPLRLDSVYAEKARARAKRDNRSVSFTMRQIFMFGLDALEAREKAEACAKH